MLVRVFEIKRQAHENQTRAIRQKEKAEADRTEANIKVERLDAEVHRRTQAHHGALEDYNTLKHETSTRISALNEDVRRF